ncbi:hypothetical protein DdX_13582 [Ditylenchus destructor]|uniref:Uncharacterized protein n=1 Tax=Ditylenchus destructor TaxID=166010 RepID=A0AAD4MW64_9BILA|nr:hypothetical protein DdX_13582 [Ditylenchus destructor]
MSNQPSGSNNAASDTTEPELTFVCEDGDIIPVPSHFHKLSKFVVDYIANFFSDGTANSDPNVSRIILSHIEGRHVRIMFIFIEEWRMRKPAEFADCCADNENAVKKIRSIPMWAQTFIQLYPRNDVILCVNAANFLGCHVVVKYFMMFLAKKLAACDSAEEMREYLNETNDFSDNERAQSLRLAESGGSWKAFIVANNATKKSAK